MNECHASLRDFYEVSVPELNTMAEIAQSLTGVLATWLIRPDLRGKNGV